MPSKRIFKDYDLKGLILRAIRNGNETTADIKNAINYPHSMDTLYVQINRLKRYGYITQTKVGRISHYTLTRKGHVHATTPDICRLMKDDYLNADYYRVRKIRENLAFAYFNNGRFLDEEFVRTWGKITPTILTKNVDGEEQIFWAADDSILFQKRFVAFDIIREGRMRDHEFVIMGIYHEGITIGSNKRPYYFRQNLKW
jgi:hypothetical protein